MPFAAAFVVMGVIFKRMAGVMPRERGASRMNAVMVEYVRGMRVIKALNMGSKSFRRFQSAVDEEHAVAWCDIARKTGPGFAAFVIIIECGMLVMVPAASVHGSHLGQHVSAVRVRRVALPDRNSPASGNQQATPR